MVTRVDELIREVAENCLNCGKKLSRIKKTNKYCSYSCSNHHTKLGNRNAYKNGRFKHNGYIMQLAKGHPRGDKDGYVQEHRLIIEKHLGRYLDKNEVAHHKNGIRDDNRLENLRLMTTSGHTSHHNGGNKYWLGRKHSEKTKLKMRKARISYFEENNLYGY